MLQRTVRHLHLAAASCEQVQHLMPRLEDALRCASLPGDGARLLVVRRLALGRLPADIGAVPLARHIERCVAVSEMAWVVAGTAGDESAAGVVFHSALDASIRLAVRLLQGASCGAWYWPPAVPSFQPARGRTDNLLLLGDAVATVPEARTALPAWAEALLHAGLGPALAAVVPAARGEAWLQAAGLNGAEPSSEAPPGPGEPPPQRGTDPRSVISAEASPLPHWLNVLDRLGRGPPQVVSPSTCPATLRMPPPEAVGHVETPEAARDDAVDSVALPLSCSTPVVNAPAEPPAPTVVAERKAPTAPDDPVAAPYLLARPATEALVLPHRPVIGEGLAHGQPTVAGGLLCLLPLLQRLGLPCWLAGRGDAPAFVAAVLQAVLQRLAVPVDDPAWALAEPPGSWLAGPIDRPAPATWADPALAPRPHQAMLLADALACAPDSSTQAVLWLTACRRWLRRRGRIGLASLMLRPGGLALTVTHADMFFALADSDLRVRRLGLDLDLGWLPWFGRVVAFHFERRWP